MTTQPEALRLADLLEQIDGQHWQVQDSAAAELRRLHAECNDLAHQLNESNERNGRIIAQRDALLEALNAMLTHMGMDEDEWNRPTFDQARAAIAKVEGKQ